MVDLTDETPAEMELSRATRQFLAALEAVDRETDEAAAASTEPPEVPGMETAENYQPPDDGDGSGPSSDEDRDDPGVPRFNAFGGDSAGW